MTDRIDYGLHEAVLAWFDTEARDLPWRRDTSPWSVLVSEFMLQQTPVSRVLPVFEAWMRRWPTPTALAADTPGEAVRAWGRLGYPRRALRLHGAAKAIVDRHGGEVPADRDALLALPGVGAYTASAVASFAFGGRHPVLDTNVRRVFARVVQGVAFPAASVTAAEHALAESLMPEHDAHQLGRRDHGARRRRSARLAHHAVRSARSRTGAGGGPPATPRTKGRRVAARRGREPIVKFGGA